MLAPLALSRCVTEHNSTECEEQVRFRSTRAKAPLMVEEKVKRVCLELMAPMVREFAKNIADMRERGATGADVADMLARVETDNRGKVDDAILDLIMAELRRVAQALESADRHNGIN